MAKAPAKKLSAKKTSTKSMPALLANKSAHYTKIATFVPVEKPTDICVLLDYIFDVEVLISKLVGKYPSSFESKGNQKTWWFATKKQDYELQIENFKTYLYIVDGNEKRLVLSFMDNKKTNEEPKENEKPEEAEDSEGQFDLFGEGEQEQEEKKQAEEPPNNVYELLFLSLKHELQRIVTAAYTQQRGAV